MILYLGEVIDKVLSEGGQITIINSQKDQVVRCGILGNKGELLAESGIDYSIGQMTSKLALEECLHDVRNMLNDN